MTGYVQLRGFRVSVDRTASRETTMESPKEGSSLFEGRFRATRVWNGMIRRFRSGMSVKRHRRQLRVFDDCFTGREAVDFMMNELPKFIHDGREITRSNCMKLLGIYMNMGLFCTVRGKSDDNEVFKENELYRFSTVSLELLAATPILVRRAASFNERSSFRQNRFRDKDFGFTAPQRMHNICWKNRNNNMMVPARIPIPLMQPNAPLSRRLSASHGNLPSMLSTRNLNNEPSGRLNVKDILKETISQEKINKVTMENIEVRAGTSKEINVLDEMIAQLAEVNSNSINCSEMQNLRHFGKVIQTQNPEGCQSSGSPGAVVNEEHSGAHLFLDTNEIYKDVLLNRLRSVLQVDSLKGIVDYDFNGADVRWNCERVGMKGIVRVQPENDYLTNYVITMMRYLSRWPFDTKFAESTHVPYDGFELNVFKSVCEQFDKDCPMLSNPIALSILHIIQLFRQRRFQQKNIAELRKETVFCADSSSFTRYVQKTINSENHSKLGSDESCNLHTTISPSKRFTSEEHIMSPPNTVRSSVSTLSAGSENFSYKMAYEAILTRLPGLQRSPELMQRIEELAKTNAFIPHSSTPYAESCILLAGIDAENEKLLKEAVSLVMLTLEPRVRRRLHYLLRFMQRVSRNYCLRMDKRRDNRSIILEALPNKIIYPSQTINSFECHQLVIFLMDNECETFSIPEVFISEVKHQLSLPHEVVIKKSPAGQQLTIDESSSTERLKQHFCEPIKVEEYESQKKDVDSYLLSLLDGILNDENLSLTDRKQRLKKFKKTYPDIYAKKFPSPELPKIRFIDRIRNFHF